METQTESEFTPIEVDSLVYVRFRKVNRAPQVCLRKAQGHCLLELPRSDEGV